MEILNKTPILANVIPLWVLVAAIAFFAFSMILHGLVGSYWSISMIVLSVIIVISVCIGYDTIVKESGRYQYEVMLGKDYCFIDVYEKFNVIEQRGKIWVLEDKEIDK